MMFTYFLCKRITQASLFHIVLWWCKSTSIWMFSRNQLPPPPPSLFNSFVSLEFIYHMADFYRKKKKNLSFSWSLTPHQIKAIISLKDCLNWIQNLLNKIQLPQLANVTEHLQNENPKLQVYWLLPCYCKWYTYTNKGERHYNSRNETKNASFSWTWHTTKIDRVFSWSWSTHHSYVSPVLWWCSEVQTSCLIQICYFILWQEFTAVFAH